MGRNPTYDLLLRERGATFGEWLGVPVVDDFGDTANEYQIASGQLDGKFGLADRSSRGTVVAIGTEVVPLLQGIVTSDVFKLAEPGSGQHGTAVNSTGRLVCDVRFMHGPEILLMDFEPGAVENGVISHFRANVMSEDARFVDRSAATSIIGVITQDPSILANLGEFEHDLSRCAVYGGTWGVVGDTDVVVRRSPFGFDILVGTESASAIWELLESRGGTPVGERALEVLRVEAGIPRWGAELDEKVIPLEAGLDDTISFNKGCYVGQEIIARLDTLGTPARRLRMLQLDADATFGDTIFDHDKKVGDLRTVVRSPQFGVPVGLAYLKRDHNALGHAVEVGETRVGAIVHDLRREA